MNVSRDLPVALPVGLLVNDERIIRCWLRGTRCIGRPRGDRVITRCRLPVKRPCLPCKWRLAALQLRRLGRTVLAAMGHRLQNLHQTCTSERPLQQIFLRKEYIL